MTPADVIATIPFAATVGIELVSATPEEAVGRLEWSEERTTTGGAMHGGAIMALADTIGAICAFLNVPAGGFTSTTSSSTVFTRGVRRGSITATARRLHAGRSTIAIVTEVRDDDGKLIAQVTQSQAVLTPNA